MKQKLEAVDRYFSEVVAALRREGFGIGDRHGEVLEVNLDDRPLCHITDNGGVRYRKENLDTADRVESMHQAAQIARTSAEYMRMMEQAPPLKAGGLEENFKVLADFNDVVLAGHQTKYGVQFVTWDWDFDRKGVSHGNYYNSDYAGAKQDFATRSGLISKDKLFTSEQLMDIYHCCKQAQASDFSLTCNQERHIEEILDQIQYQIPDVEEQVNKAMAQSLEPEYEQTM